MTEPGLVGRCDASRGRREAMTADIRDSNAPFDTTNITIGLASDGDRDDWNLFVESLADAEAYHQYDWRFIFEQVFKNDCYYLIARAASGCILGVLPLVHLKSWVFGNYLVSVPCFSYCGILSSHDEVRKALCGAANAQAKILGAGHIEFRHRDNFELGLPFRDDKVSMQLALPESDKVLWERFSGKLRAQIRRP